MDLRSVDPVSRRVVFDVVCGRGTYVRSLCSDMGQLLGTGAAMSFLLRTASGSFLLEDAVTPEELHDHWEEHLLPIDFPLSHLGKLTIAKQRVDWFSNGGYLRRNEVELERMPDPPGVDGPGTVRGRSDGYGVYCGGLFLGTARYDEDNELFFADKVLCK